MTDALGYIKGLTRFNYWNYPAINPDLLHKTQPLDMSSTSAHQYLSAMYQRDYAAGTVQAIFEYAKADVWAFRAPWVVSQIEAWRSENTPESRKKIHKLTRAYTDDRGKDRPAVTLRLIKRDQAVFKAIMSRHQQDTPLEQCFTTIAQQSRPPDNLGTQGVQAVYTHYQRKMDELMGKPPSRRVQKIVEESMARLGSPAPDWDQPPPHGVAMSWQEAMQRLEAMAQGLENLIGT